MQAASALALDDAAQPIIAGEYAGVLDFGGGPLTSATGADLFVASFHSDGSPRWSTHVAGNFSSSRLSIGHCGEALVATNLAGAPAVVEIDSTGALSWQKVFSSQSAIVTSIATDSEGHAVIAGDFASAIDLGCGVLSPRGGLAAGSFVAELDSKGACSWSTSFGGDKIHAGALATGADGSVWISGTFETEADFGGGHLEGNDLEVAFVWLLKLDEAGKYGLARVFRTTGTSPDAGFAVTSTGDVVITGSVTGNPPVAIDFGTGMQTSPTVSAAYLARFDAQGALLWSRVVGPDPSGGFAVAVAPNGDVVAEGQLQGKADFGGGITVEGTGVYVARFDAKGNAHAAKVLDGAFARALAVDGLGNAFLAGGFTGMINLGTGVLTSAGGSDVFLADVGQ